MSQTVSFVNIADVMDHLGFEHYEIDHIYETAFDHVSYGDALYTLIGNQEALSCILNGYHDYHIKHIANKAFTSSEVIQKFWQIVGEQDYINMEG